MDRPARYRLSALCFLIGCALSACADPCAQIEGPAEIFLGGADASGLMFESVSPGEERALIIGGQGGMHVWIHLRMRGMCPATTVVERRGITASDELVTFGRGVPSFVDGSSEGEHELDAAFAMVMCPSGIGRSVAGETIRFEVHASDDADRTADATVELVPRCDDPGACDLYCEP